MTFRQFEINRIIRNVCDGTDVSLEDIRGEKRTETESFARFIMARKLRDYGMTLKAIGAVMNRGHMSVINALKQYDAMFSTNRMFRDMVRDVELVSAIPDNFKA